MVPRRIGLRSYPRQGYVLATGLWDLKRTRWFFLNLLEILNGDFFIAILRKSRSLIPLLSFYNRKYLNIFFSILYHGWRNNREEKGEQSVADSCLCNPGSLFCELSP